MTVVENRTDRISMSKIRNVAGVEYTKWLCNPRMMIIIILFVFLNDYIIEELINATIKLDSMIMILEPFIAMANSELLIMVIPAVFIVLISDFPKTDGNSMFYILRIGKINWMLGQLLFGAMAAITYLSGLVLISSTLVARHAYAKNMWSPVVTNYTNVFTNETHSRIAMLINGRLYNNMTPLQAFGLTLTLMFLYLLTMELFLLVGFSVGKRILGMLISYTIIAVGSSLCGLNSQAQWFFPSSHSIAWLHYDLVLRIQKVNIKYSFLYFVGIITVMFVISMISIKRYDFAKITDMED